MDLAPGDGSEAFCVCKYGYAGENCEKKVQKQSSSILESAELRKWSEKLRVPGMFDLMDAIERSTEVITDHVTKVKFWTCSLQSLFLQSCFKFQETQKVTDAVYQSNNQTLKFMFKSQDLVLNAINDVVDKVSDTYDAVLWSGEETRKTIASTALATGHFTRDLSKKILFDIKVIYVIQ